MPSVTMERGRQKLILGDDFTEDMMNTGGICFSCEQIFASRKFLEEHVCPSASHICSCGTEFAEYEDMLFHSTTHEPGHQVLDHETIRKRRIEKCMEEEEKLKRLQSGEVVWKVPKSYNAHSKPLLGRSASQAPNRSTRVPQSRMQSAQNQQVPALYQSVSRSSLSNPIQSETDMQNIFAGVGAPTVDLWTFYQPVVLVQTVRKFNKNKPYTCGKCGEGFTSRNYLISHHSSHVTDKVSGCIGCGLLLSSKKLVPRFHICNSPSTATKFRLITAKPVNLPGLYPNARLFHASPKSFKSAHRCERGQMLHAASALQLKNQELRSHYRNSQRQHVSPSLQSRSQFSNVNITLPLMSKSHSPKAFVSNKHRWGLHSHPSAQLRTCSSSGALAKPMQIYAKPKGFTCRVCYIPFETPQLLQRHKCVKAQEFMAKHSRVSKQFIRQRRVIPLGRPGIAQMNGGRKFAFAASSNLPKKQVVAVGFDKGQGAVPINAKTTATATDFEDDCYIVESGTDKPAEMIYQVTSSVPIKT